MARKASPGYSIAVVLAGHRPTTLQGRHWFSRPLDTCHTWLVCSFGHGSLLTAEDLLMPNRVIATRPHSKIQSEPISHNGALRWLISTFFLGAAVMEIRWEMMFLKRRPKIPGAEMMPISPNRIFSKTDRPMLHHVFLERSLPLSSGHLHPAHVNASSLGSVRLLVTSTTTAIRDVLGCEVQWLGRLPRESSVKSDRHLADRKPL